MIAARILFPTIGIAALSACASPNFVDKGKGEDEALELNPPTEPAELITVPPLETIRLLPPLP